MSRRCVLAFAFLLALPLAAASPVQGADLRRLESVGVVGILEEGRRPLAPRDTAVRAAVARGVEAVAGDLLPEGWEEDARESVESGAGPGDLSPLLVSALGQDPFEYATRFRILEDRGMRAALFSTDPSVESEYVVVVEVFVDVGRVRERLRAAGWIETPAGQDAGSHVRLVVEGLESFGAYEALRRALIDDLDVRSALPVELSRGRAVLDVDGPYGADSLLQALIAQAGSGLRVVPLERNERTLTLLVDWTPPPASRAPEPEEGTAIDPRLAE